MRTKPLKGPEKICRSHCFLGLPLKGFLLCLGILATRKRVYEFLDAYLVGYLVLLQLILDVSFNCFFVSSKVMDAILSGMTQSKQILVISKKWQDIAEEIMTSLNRGVTQIKAKGVYSGQERPVLLCVIGKRQTGQLLQAVRKHDTSAFVIITEAREVLGEGFDSTALGMSADGKKLFKLHRKTTKKP